MATAPDSTLVVADYAAVRVLTLNRPARRNALDLELLEGLQRELFVGAAAPGVGAFVLTGAPPAFCSGMDRDLLAAEPARSAARARFLRGLAELLDGCAAHPKPIVAAVNGPAVAGGAALVCAADIAIGSTEASLGCPGIRESLVAAAVVPALRRAVGPRWARHLLLTGARLDAAGCHRLGLFHEVVAARECLPRALCVAAELAALPEGAVAAAKRYLRETLEGSLDPTAMHLPDGG